MHGFTDLCMLLSNSHKVMKLPLQGRVFIRENLCTLVQCNRLELKNLQAITLGEFCSKLTPSKVQEDPISPAISVCWQKDSEQRKIIINCTAPDQPKEVTVLKFFLHSNGQNNRIQDSTAKGFLHAQFRREVVSRNEKFGCSYELKVKEEPYHHIESQVSNFLQPEECDINYPLTEATPTVPADITTDNTMELATRHGQSALWVPVISSLCGILILLILVIILVCIFRKKKSSKRKMKTSDFPENVDADTTIEATYSSIVKSKNIVTPNVEVNMQDPNVVDDDGITYAILNNVHLNKTTMTKKHDDTSLYAEVNKSIKK
ncbi:uncharacterized protein LOC134965241 [Pseudophryne corroboree]|uniref:uncharacterized protein LOC134965241 n=1 Tax=Pseudophryne corroboree TaxID=495146 RepID=UPI003081EAAA